METGDILSNNNVWIIKTFIISVLASLFAYWIPKKVNIWISRLVKWQVDYFKPIVISLLVIGIYLIYYGNSYLGNERWFVVGPGIFLFILIGLCIFIKKNSVILSKKEIDKKKTITPKGIHSQASTKQIPVYRINPMNDGDYSISWYAFGQGIEVIISQLKTIRESAIEPDLIFGVNTPGYAIAQCVGRFLNVTEVKLIRTSPLYANNKRKYDDLKNLPNKENVRCIIIVDGKLKSGNSIMNLYDEIDGKYPNADIICIAFIGFVDPSDKLMLEDFGRKGITDNKYRPDCIAFYAEESPVNFPYAIR